MYDTLSASVVLIAAVSGCCCCCCCRILLAFGRVLLVLDNQTDPAAIIINADTEINNMHLYHFLPFLFLLLFMMLVVVSWN
jgi:hypothetical protein